MLIFSFRYGFNPGSTLMISTAQLGDVASLVAVNTTLGAAGGKSREETIDTPE